VSDEAVHAAATPNDPRWSQLWGMKTGGAGTSAELAWNTTTGSSDVVVGILDTGIDATHPDLAPNVWNNRTGVGGCGYGTHGYDFVSNDCAPVDDDDHGTHVAGTIGAVGSNGVGVTGMNWHVSLMSLKMLDRNGDGTLSDALAAMDWAVQAKRAGVNVRVLNASWGSDLSPGGRSVIDDELDYLRRNGILFVAAAGNDGLDVEQVPIYPCASPMDNVVCVAAIDESGRIASFSDYGAQSVDIAAPGVDIWSTVPVVDGGYAAYQGTSMATPHVTGAAALVLSADPSLGYAGLRSRLLAAVDPFVSPDPDPARTVNRGGWLDVCKAVPGCGTIAAAAPSAPRGVGLRARHRAVVASWQAPTSNGNGSAVTSYRVTASNGFDSGVLPATARSLTIGGLSDNTNVDVTVTASNAVGASAGATHRARPTGGGFEVDAWGGLHAFAVGGNPAPSAPTGNPYWPGTGFGRGVALLPDGTGGYVLDAYGGLHPFGVGGNPAPPAATGVAYWLGADIARGVAVVPQGTGGYVVDLYGGMHPFGIGDHARPGQVTNGPYWPGWDIARGVTLTTARSGWIVDGFGGVQPFAAGGAALPPKPSRNAYWLGWDIARGITVVPGRTGGYVLDGYGGLHVFATGSNPPPGPGRSPYWLGWDIARGASA
jgi:hypothetical protein